jgi:hypothetical protein
LPVIEVLELRPPQAVMISAYSFFLIPWPVTAAKRTGPGPSFRVPKYQHDFILLLFIEQTKIILNSVWDSRDVPSLECL